MEHTPKKPIPRRRDWLSLNVALIYVFLGAGWIYFSDTFSGMIAPDSQSDVPISLIKGLMYILVTAALLFFIIHRGVIRIQRSEEALAESNRRFCEMFENVHLIAMMLDTGGNISFCNDYLLRLTGWNRDEVIGKSWFELFLPADVREVIGPLFFHRILAGDVPPHVENEIITRHGERRLIAWNNTLLRDAHGQIIGATTIGEDVTERKKAEEVLRETNSRLENILESISDAFFSMDDNLVVTYFNAAAERMVNRRAPDVIGKYLFDAFPEARGSIFDEKYNYAIAEKVFVAFETYFDVAPYRNWYDVRVYPQEDGISVYFQIITERKRVEEAARTEEEKYRLLVRQVPGVLFKGYADYGLDCFDDKIETLTGYTQDEFNSRAVKWNDILLEEYRAPVREQLKKALKDDGFYVSEFRIRKKSGELIWVQARNQVVKNAQGRMDYISGVFFDITERKRAKEDLLESENKFKSFAENSLVGIYLVHDGIFKYVNPKFAQMFGYTVEECLNDMHYRSLVYAEDLGKVDEQVEKRVSGEVEFIHFTFRGLKKNGQSFHVEVYASTGNYRGMPAATGTILDITERMRGEDERKKLEEQLSQAQKMESVGRLAGGVAHDFNNMLGVIIGRAEMVLGQDVSTNVQRNLKEILNAGLRSADLTRQLLAFARKQTAVPKILDLNDTISGMIKMLRRLIGEDIDLHWVPGLDLWKVRIDPSQVDQILANLAVNARDAIPGVGTITLRTDNVVIDDSHKAEHPEFIPGAYILLTVSDSGEGMSQEVLEKIFEPFFTTKELGKGTGLGLSTVYGIVKQNDGFIYVASEPEKGATFKIYLPRFAVETSQAASEEVAGKRLTGTETILLVEDDDAILNLSKLVLETRGYTVLAAQTPAHAIHLVEEHPGDVHLLITDVIMPEMNGRELAEKLNGIRPSLKCLYMSGYTADVIAHRGILDEGVNFIQKPFGNNDLAARVREILDRLE